MPSDPESAGASTTAPRSDLDSTRAFLCRLPIPRGTVRELRMIVPDTRGARQEFPTTLEDATKVVQRWSGRANIYIGACPRSSQNGARRSVRIVTAAWADLDFHQIDPNDRGLAERTARRRLDTIGRRPTVLVHTGNGVQAWWLYREPWQLTEDWPADRFEAINRGIAERIGGNHVHDIARVLRIPGTWNLPDSRKRARGCVPVMARLLWTDGPTYEVGDLARLAVEEQEHVRRRRPTSVPQTDCESEEIVAAFCGLMQRLGSGHPLCRVWRGDRILKDISRSGWDMAFANQLVRSEIKDEFVPAIMRAFPHGRGVFATDDYIYRTIAKAKSFKERQSHGAA